MPCRAPIHRPLHAAKRKRFEQHRPSRSVRGYTRNWYRFRYGYLTRHPMCGCGALATEVDHKQRIADGGAMYDEGNLQAMCKPCHSRKTVREDGGFGQGRGA